MTVSELATSRLYCYFVAPFCVVRGGGPQETVAAVRRRRPKNCSNMKMKLLLLLLPAVALASIEVNVAGTVYFESNYVQGNINQRGLEQRDIIKNDLAAFQILDNEVMSAAERYLGKKPDQVFLTRSTPWGDLHSTYRLSPVQVKIEPGLANVIDINSQVEVLTRKIYQNDNSVQTAVFVQESATTRDTVTSYWRNPRQVSGHDVDITLYYYVEKDLVSMSHAYTFGFNRRIASPKVRSQRGSLNLGPRQKVMAQFEVKKGKLQFEIPYKVSLFGDVVVWYNNAYQGKQIHNMDINQIMTANQRNATLTVFQTVVHEFYYAEKLKILDADQDGYNTVLKTIQAEGGTSGGNKRRAGIAKDAAETGTKITKKASMAPNEITDEDLKNIKEEIVTNELDEESSESKED